MLVKVLTILLMPFVYFLFICVFQVYVGLFIGLYLLVIDTAQMLCSTPLSIARYSDVRIVLNRVSN
jgi:hypothetical protein